MEHPVETAKIIFQASDALLRYAANHEIKGYLYVSSMEVYGSIFSEESITEDMQGYLNPLDVRSCYPMAKRMAENLCCLYAQEYGVKAKIARLTQTTGAGISRNDNRAIAQFVRCALENQNIILQTAGTSARPYCYTIDAISAMLYILLKGQSGQAYNVANEDTFMTIRDLAELVKETINPNINVNTIINDIGYAAPSILPLSTAKLNALGWHPQYGLQELLLNLAEDVKT
jgi:nucleoside-diphosphate-sugar epimerase